MQRAAAVDYGGMWAFPGGRVEDDDAHPDDPGDEIERARRTAVREAGEEVGLPFRAEDLVPFSHWTGGAQQARLYAAWYFLAPAPADPVACDGYEIVDHRWIAPAEAVALRDRGEIAVVAPTWVTLHTLTAADSVAGALALATGRRPVVYLSRLSVDGERRIVLWDGDAGYPTGDPAVPGSRHRLTMAETGWAFERT